jgi:hypothetical protein
MLAFLATNKIRKIRSPAENIDAKGISMEGNAKSDNTTQKTAKVPVISQIGTTYSKTTFFESFHKRSNNMLPIISVSIKVANIEKIAKSI